MATPTTLPASFTSGQVLTAAQMNNLRGAFRILQVVNATNNSTTTITTSTYTGINLTASITPSSTSSKILVFGAVTAILKQNNTYAALKLFRGVTDIATVANYINYTNTALDMGSSASFVWLDSPATTSATTYEVKMASVSNISYVQANTNGTNSLTLMEVSA